jgi:hypothetical protein
VLHKLHQKHAMASASVPVVAMQADGAAWGAALLRREYLPVLNKRLGTFARMVPRPTQDTGQEAVPTVFWSIAGRISDVPPAFALICLLPEMSIAVQKSQLSLALRGSSLHPLTMRVRNGVVQGEELAGAPDGWYFLKASASSYGRDVHRVLCDGGAAFDRGWPLASLLRPVSDASGSQAPAGTALAREDGILQQEVLATDPSSGSKCDLRVWAALSGDGDVWIAPTCIRRVCAGNFAAGLAQEALKRSEAATSGTAGAVWLPELPPAACYISNRNVLDAATDSDCRYGGSTTLGSSACANLPRRDHVATPPEAASCIRRCLGLIRAASLSAGTPAAPNHHIQVCGMDVAIVYPMVSPASAASSGECTAAEAAPEEGCGVGWRGLHPTHASTTSDVSEFGGMAWPVPEAGRGVLIEVNRAPTLDLCASDSREGWREEFKTHWVRDLCRWAALRVRKADAGAKSAGVASPEHADAAV